ncbi:MAG: DUF3570 domain-containing protein [Thiotrichales bacterium]|nr:DUF3570 domain-containing protein [Thiotrichales bacterium]
MQLKSNTILAQLTVASLSCLGVSGAFAAEWELDSAVLLYSEKDRVNAVEPAVNLKRTAEDGSVLGIKLVVDSLTGASPNGATAANQPQTFTTPSGKDTYTTPAGEIPLDDTFKDTRGQLSLSYDAPLSSGNRYTLGANLSSEYDYASASLSGGMTHYFNQKNTALNWGLSLAFDQADPVGGVPVGSTDTQLRLRDGQSDTRTSVEALFGITQILDKNSLIQLNFGLASSSGYHTDPYKLVSLLDANGDPTAYYYENRPDSRLRAYLYANYRRHLSWGDTVETAYRLASDDWGILSHTLDAKYRWNLSERWALTPRLRFYQQSAADFYTHHLNSVPSAGETLSADSRLASLQGITVGAKLSYQLSSKQELSLRLEQYEQSADDSADQPGVQAQLPQSSDLSATIVQFGYKLRF